MNFEEENDMTIGEEERIFFIDTLNTNPFLNVDLYIQCDESDLTENLRQILLPSEYSWGVKIKLRQGYKLILINEIATHNLHMYFASVEARLADVKLFEMYDGCLYGEFSKNLTLPKWFSEKYQNSGVYSISKEW